MGLERISAVMQHVHSNYEIDLFQALLKAAARETSDADMDSPSLKVLADHRIGAVVVSGDGASVEGIVSERDVVRHLHSGGAQVLDGTVGRIMTRDVHTCTTDDDRNVRAMRTRPISGPASITSNASTSTRSVTCRR